MAEEKALITKETYQISIQELAKNAIDSGMYQDIKTAEQAIMKIIAGKELGLSPLFSLQKLLYVKNQITCMGEVIVYLWQKDGYTWQRIMYNKKGEDIELPATEDKALYGCGILLWSPSGKLLTKDPQGGGKPCTFDLGRAAIAGLLSKDNWKNYPDRLLFYRAVAFTARDYSPGLTGGMPTTEEMQDVVELQKANVKQIATGGGVATVQHINVESPICPKHTVSFELKKGRGGATWWAHITDEKDANGNLKWCNKSKIDEEYAAKSEGLPNPPQIEPEPPPAWLQGEEQPPEGLLESMLADDDTFKENTLLAMKALSWKNKELLDYLKSIKVTKLSELSLGGREKVYRHLQELIDLKNA